MKTVKINCDGCGADLTLSGNCVDYRLSLSNENIPSRGGFVTAMGIYPSLDHDHHFCGLSCLDHWTDRRRYRSNLWKEWQKKWEDEHGHKDESGRVRSYPCPPDDVVKARDLAFDAAALEAFPMSRQPHS